MQEEGPNNPPEDIVISLGDCGVVTVETRENPLNPDQRDGHITVGNCKTIEIQEISPGEYYLNPSTIGMFLIGVIIGTIIATAALEVWMRRNRQQARKAVRDIINRK